MVCIRKQRKKILPFFSGKYEVTDNPWGKINSKNKRGCVAVGSAQVKDSEILLYGQVGQPFHYCGSQFAAERVPSSVFLAVKLNEVFIKQLHAPGTVNSIKLPAFLKNARENLPHFASLAFTSSSSRSPANAPLKKSTLEAIEILSARILATLPCLSLLADVTRGWLWRTPTLGGLCFLSLRCLNNSCSAPKSWIVDEGSIASL